MLNLSSEVNAMSTYGEMYDEYLDEIAGPVEIGNLRYDASRVLKEVDPVAYRCGFNDWSDSACCCDECGASLDVCEDDEYRELCDECSDKAEQENEEDDAENVEEGDLTTEDHQRFYQYGRLVLTVGEDEDMAERVRAYMDSVKFWPNCWFISDHGNAHLMDLN